MAGFRTFWAAVVGVWEETLVLLGGNLLALALNVPLFLVGTAVAYIATAEPPTALTWAVLATPMVFLPTPGNLALAGVTQVAAGPDVPRVRLFAATLRARWGVAWRCTLVSVGVLAAVLWNVTFYVNLGPSWALLVTILWLYAAAFWLSMHVYLAPLAVHVAEPRVLDLYRRAAFVTVGHAPYTFVLLLLLLTVTVASVLFLPVYVLITQSFVSLVQAHALREIRRRHGDLVAEAEEEEVGHL